MADGGVHALIFDYGGVLMRTFDPTPRRQLERDLGLARGAVDELVFGSPRWDDVQHGHIASAAFWSDVGRRIELEGDAVEAFRRRFWSGDRLDQELVRLIRHLCGAGYRTALLSNAPAELRAFIEELGIADAFDLMVISGEEGLMKPAPEIYERVLERLEVSPQEAVFVDDMRPNVAAARAVGLHATRFRGLTPLRLWLRDLGVAVPEPERQPVPDLEAVIFDWGGVMEELTGEKEVSAWERRLAVQDGVLLEILWGEAWRQLEVGAISDEEYARRIGEDLGLPDHEEALRFLQEFYTDDRFNARVMEAARALRGRYQVALLTNAFPSQRETIRDTHGIDVAAEFDVYVNSADVGLAKPDPEIFHLTLDRLDVAPGRAVFVDDTLRNVDAAREIGLHAVQFVDPETSLGALEELLGHPIEG